MCIVNISLLAYSFLFADLCFTKNKRYELWWRSDIIFFGMVYASSVPTKKYLPTRRPMIHFKIILFIVRTECQEHVFHNSIKFFPYNFFFPKRLTLPHLNSLAVLLKINWWYMYGFIYEMYIPFHIFIWLFLLSTTHSYLL